jgi:hypothetical protein
MERLSLFRDITPVSPSKINRCFAGICRLHLQAKEKTNVKQMASSLDVVSQEIEYFINTALRISKHFHISVSSYSRSFFVIIIIIIIIIINIIIIIINFVAAASLKEGGGVHITRSLSKRMGWENHPNKHSHLLCMPTAKI